MIRHMIGHRIWKKLESMKPTDIPNGVIVVVRRVPILIDFDEAGNPVEGDGTELKGSQYEKTLPCNRMMLVHTVKGGEAMLIKSLGTLHIADKQGKPIAATDLGRKNELLPLLKKIRAEYVLKLQAEKK